PWPPRWRSSRASSRLRPTRAGEDGTAGAGREEAVVLSRRAASARAARSGAARARAAASSATVSLRGAWLTPRSRSPTVRTLRRMHVTVHVRQARLGVGTRHAPRERQALAQSVRGLGPVALPRRDHGLYPQRVRQLESHVLAARPRGGLGGEGCGPRHIVHL